ncbi:GFA family protein [Sinorhizobium sp. 8-89]|uniref:GFA family protein n=1 Tax=Sinorhizobium sp. 7-81 TaxID=3049087 RepID=UPI0024C28889|nr:GFA family protein [Sinorhizobium sp. 7-81]MDK1386836.1 GFA family protein [Sinorhizobium sp. 7-81]
MIEGHCHCRSVRITVPSRPETLGDCNCSLCSRLGALWGYYPVNGVTVSDEHKTLVGYVQGAASLTMHHCGRCGCTTHWSPRGRDGTRMGVNMRIFDRSVWEEIPHRLIDGASW